MFSLATRRALPRKPYWHLRASRTPSAGRTRLYTSPRNASGAKPSTLQVSEGSAGCSILLEMLTS